MEVFCFLAHVSFHYVVFDVLYFNKKQAFKIILSNKELLNKTNLSEMKAL